MPISQGKEHLWPEKVTHVTMRVHTRSTITHTCVGIYIYIYFSLTRAMHGKVLKNTKIFQLRSAQFSEKMNVTINVFGGLREI